MLLPVENSDSVVGVDGLVTQADGSGDVGVRHGLGDGGADVV